MKPDLETAILLLVAEHVEAAEGRRETVDIRPVVTALASVLAKTISGTEPDSKARAAALLIVRDQIAAALVEDAIETAMARPGERVTAQRFN